MSAKLIALALAFSGTYSTAQPDVVREVPLPDDPWVQACEDWDEWDKPGPPFRVFGNSWYVGTCGIAAILIAGDEGHILIDSGTEAGAEMVLANIRKLGFDPADIVLLLTSHEHFDHIGGMAHLQEVTGAPVVTSPAAASVLRSGEAGGDDPQAGMHAPMTPVGNVAVYDTASRFAPALDRFGLEAVATPGHTPGALSWKWKSCEGADCAAIVYADSLSPVSSDSYRFSEHPAYVAAYRAGLAKLAALDCDILLTPHPSASKMPERLASPGGLHDREACRNYAGGIGARLDERLAKERGKQGGE